MYMYSLCCASRLIPKLITDTTLHYAGVVVSELFNPVPDLTMEKFWIRCRIQILIQTILSTDFQINNVVQYLVFVMLEAALLPRKLSSHSLLSNPENFYTVSVSFHFISDTDPNLRVKN
jgi:hypothetical protein